MGFKTPVLWVSDHVSYKPVSIVTEVIKMESRNLETETYCLQMQKADFL